LIGFKKIQQRFHVFSGSEIYVLDSTNVSKRTRGVQSSIETAMALKEKRATLFEAKDIRKVKTSHSNL